MWRPVMDLYMSLLSHTNTRTTSLKLFYVSYKIKEATNRQKESLQQLGIEPAAIKM